MSNTYRAQALTALLAVSVLPVAQAQEWKPAKAPLMTRWAKDVSPRNTLPDYPRPQLSRAQWQSLNGLWSYNLTGKDEIAAPATNAGQILVPYPYESALSGVMKGSIPNQKLWYRRNFTVPRNWNGQRILLHFGAVNHEAAVWVNGQKLGSHTGGYDEFSFDITDALKAGNNELVVSVLNPVNDREQVLGKQRLKPGGIFYTSATGIWQTVWIEPVPVAHIDGLTITPDLDASQLRVTVKSSGAAPVKVTAMDGRKTIATVNGQSNTQLNIPIPNAKLWTPETPFLYDLKVDLGNGRGTDSVKSYAAMRKISLGKDEQGRTRIFLNNKFVFQVGALDQGYWPDGIYTAPTDEALKFDIVAAKDLGFNMLRKHAKVEPARWYYHADKLGMLVWQDMPQMYGDSAAVRAQYEAEWREIMAENHNSPSIVIWTPFNEAWGQFDTERIAALTKQLDPSRLVNSVSGWTDKGVGDIHDYHAYPVPKAPPTETARASVCGEFGGVTLNIPGRRWDESVKVMGYGSTLQSSWQATKRYQELLKTAWELKDEPGASAMVYTQITDVEQEINGLLTYDRDLTKLDAKIVAAANRGVFLPIGPDPSPIKVVVPTSESKPLTWRYTFAKPAENWMQPSFSDATWQTGIAPFGKDAGGMNTRWDTSDIWIRRLFLLTSSVPAKLNLLVKHDEDAEIYVNGVLAGTVSGYNDFYAEVPMSEAARATLKPGPNTIAVHCRQTTGGQSIDVGIATPPLQR